MKTNIKFTGMERNDTLRAYAEEKVGAFKKLMSERVYDGAICDVEFRLDAHHQTGDVCYAEVTLEADGQIYRVSKAEETHEKAIDKIKDDVLESLRAEKGRAETQYRKGAREAKETVLEL